MGDDDCTALLKWALPRLSLRWAGFVKVRGQVCKRLRHRIKALSLSGFAAYQNRLEADPREWRVLDDCCRVTISRFFRDRKVFEALRTHVLPEIAAQAVHRQHESRCWSAGCASGEEPYTIKVLWDLEVAKVFPGATLAIIGTDIDEEVLSRARGGCYPSSSLHELPQNLIVDGFDRKGDQFCVRQRHRQGIDFSHQDLRRAAPSGLFDLILCRNLAFTYFDLSLQREVLTRLVERLSPNGWLVIGKGEQLPEAPHWLKRLDEAPQIFQLRGQRAPSPTTTNGAQYAGCASCGSSHPPPR
jgi:chemotaxis protein methyltransferase CheR